MATIDVVGLSKRYGAVTAVQPLHFSVDAGQVFGFLGPNGAGKTTTLRMLATLLSPTSGHATIAGLELSNAVEVRRQLGIVNGGMHVPERLTGHEVLRFFGGLHGLTDGLLAERIDWVRELLHIDVAVMSKLTKDMSTGMQQKLVVARALLHQPKVLLLDEASAGLDLFARRALLDVVLTYRNRPDCAVVYSTHIMGEAEELCSHVGFLHQGQLLFVGTADEARQRGDGQLERAFFRTMAGAHR
jgi:sodium transport system ATP-binding protein